MATGREVYIRQNPSLDLTEQGIWLPASVQDRERDNRGVVLYVGPGTRDEPMAYKPGDIVKYDQYAARQIRIEGEDVSVVVDTDIYCVFKPDSKICLP